jgi:hypothetical protein
MAPATPDILDLDEQDQTETFDETHLDEDGAEFLTAEEAPDVFDATSALGDGRDVRALDAADLDPEALDDEDLEDDEDVDGDLDDDLEDEEEDDDIDDVDPDDEDAVAELGWNEVDVETVADVDLVAGPGRQEADDYESEELSDPVLSELGYAEEDEDEDASKDQEKAVAKPPARRRTPLGRHPDDVRKEVNPHQDELLDEGVEETFPASDPVSVKRIT